jgi:hypothetical protein
MMTHVPTWLAVLGAVGAVVSVLAYFKSASGRRQRRADRQLSGLQSARRRASK